MKNLEKLPFPYSLGKNLNYELDFNIHASNIKLNPEYSSDFVLEYNAEGYITYCNPAACKKLGYKRSEILNRHFTEFVCTEHLEKIIGFYSNQFKQKIEICYLEFKYLTKDKKEYWIGQRSILIINEGWIEGFKTNGIEISEKKIWNEASFDLREYEEKIKIDAELLIKDSKKTSVLIVEDNKLNLMVTGKFLQSWGIGFDTAESGKEAIQKLSIGSFDLILMDVYMPEMDGFETSKYIREYLPQPISQIPIIALTASDLSKSEHKIKSSGINSFILKPFNPSELKKIIFEFISDNDESNRIIELYEEKDEYVNLKYLYEISNGSDEFVKSIIEVFVQQTPIHILSLKEACKKVNWDDIGQIMHKTKATFNTMGIKALEEGIELIENLSEKKINLELIELEIEEINKTCQKVYLELKKKLSKLNP